MSGWPKNSPPEPSRLTPRQQMAIDCARCGRELGARGRVLGEVRYGGFPFKLWACAPACPPRTDATT
ncbi:hypothetical protein [Streptomyces sp. NPDC095613]|uniref:hypothetical protein n=1 Tax=Streptomyces sp. NPDC095613 TaxID=3155540 RepID=UPI00332D832B